MAKSCMIVGNPETTVWVFPGSNPYFMCANAPLLFDTTRTNVEITYRTPGTFTKARVTVIGNNLALDSTLHLMVNGVSVNTFITIPASTTGDFESDAALSDVISAGDEVCFYLEVGGSEVGETIYLSSASINFTPTTSTDTVVRHAAANFAQIVNAQTYYFALCDNCLTLSGTQAHARFDCNSAGTIKNLFVKASQFTGLTSCKVALMVNGAQAGSPANLEVTVSGTTIVEDLANSVTIAADDDVCLRVITVGTGSVTLEIASVEWVSTNKKFHSIFAFTGTANALGYNNTRYAHGGGGAVVTLYEDRAKARFGFGVIVSHLTAYVSLNTLSSFPDIGAGLSFRVRKNEADGNGFVSHAEGAAASQIEDDSNTDTFLSTDDLSLKITTTGTVGTATFRHVGMMIENTDPGPAPDFRPRVMLI
jgi:hypothetical protein